MSDPFDRIDEEIEDDGRIDVPKVGSLREFLLNHARVKISSGEYGPYTLEGREGFNEILDTFDLVFGSHTGKLLKDAELDICGGAQIGKTIFELWTGVYVTAVLWMNWGLYLPDDDIVEGVVDLKLRPDVIEQLDWLAPLMAVGKGEDKNGKSVNRKGAFRVSDGVRKAFGMIRGMGKIPTTFSMDVAMEDEKDDIPDKRSKFLTGRMTASDLRLRCSIGTQRVAGRGQNKRWKDGSQGVMMFTVPGGEICLEESWPQCCRMAITGTPRRDDPVYDYTANFTTKDGTQYAPKPGAVYYLADPTTGEQINRRLPRWEHRRPERKERLRYSWRMQQLGLDAIDLQQIVFRWVDAVKDPEFMTVFRCDVLGDPANTSQAISDQEIERARGEHDMSLSNTGFPVYAGLDTGDQCWFAAREIESAARKRIKWIQKIPLGDVVSRTVALCRLMEVGVLMIDARPHAQQARQICWTLHDLDGFDWPQVDNPDKAKIDLGELTWDGERGEWLGLKAAVVEFTRKPGTGTIHKLGQHEEDGKVRFYPVIQASRYDSIDRVVSEYLTPKENVVRVIDNVLIEDPVISLPRNVAGSPPVVAEFDQHTMVGSERDDKGEYVDGCDNHLLLANAYSSLAEQIGASAREPVEVDYEPLTPDEDSDDDAYFAPSNRSLSGAI